MSQSNYASKTKNAITWRFFLVCLVGPFGFEPKTNGLKGHCSTIEL